MAVATMNQILAKRLRSVREKRELSQEELGRRIGVNRATIANIENCRQGVSLETFLRLCIAFDHDPNDLLTREVMETVRSHIPPILDESLPDEDRRRVESALSDLLT